jgi:hypothetical protein
MHHWDFFAVHEVSHHYSFYCSSIANPWLHPLSVAANVPESEYYRSKHHLTYWGFVRGLQQERQRSRYDRGTFPLTHSCCLEICKVRRGCWEKHSGLMLHEALKNDWTSVRPYHGGFIMFTCYDADCSELWWKEKNKARLKINYNILRGRSVFF